MRSSANRGTDSVGLAVSDLNDLLTPSPSCVLQIKSAPAGSFAAPMFPVPAPSVRVQTSEQSTEPREESKSVARIALSDCLTCSGCVTSAETVMMTSHSVDEFRRVCSAATKAELELIVSLSQQSIASLAHVYNLSLQECAARIATTLRSRFGAHRVVSVSAARNVALVETAVEFEARYRSGSPRRSLPLLVSSCPGFVCYVEKRLAADQLKHLSSTRSPMAIAGTLIKQYTPSAYHVSVMPCADKKLEAMRTQLGNAVDIVLTTSELNDFFSDGDELMLLDTHSIKNQQLELDSFDPLLPEEQSEEKTRRHGRLASSGGGTSGGYGYHVFRHAAREIFGVELPDDIEQHERVIIRTVKNADMRELVLLDDTPDKSGNRAEILRFAIAYGFRNIQNIMRKISRAGKRAPQYHFVEIMACPSGCINGGGQIAELKKNTSESIDMAHRKACLNRIRERFDEAPVQRPHRDPDLLQIYSSVGAVPSILQDTNVQERRLAAPFHTTFQVVEKTLAADLAW
mmetsp:Transcript_15688/g.33909  ORF Transcript_15688/g.33909 Transcript_15688/m.33909 type:complete len:516 (+) Transcript_15688:66-1613(+)